MTIVGGVPGSLLAEILAVLPTVPGWCTPAKAERLAAAIVECEASLCVEIGVFGGSSLLPQALAIASLGGDHRAVYGIDPWTREAALEEMISKENRDWWASTDLEQIYQGCRKRVEELGLEPHVRLIRAKASDVASTFHGTSIDVLHVDGNHSTPHSLRDVELYVPLVRSGGFIFLDDVSWREGDEVTTRPAYDRVSEVADRIDLVADCAVFRKR